MSEWKTYKVYMPWKSSDHIYMVGRRIDDTKPDGDENMEWNGFYSTNPDECRAYARELNRREHGTSTV